MILQVSLGGFFGLLHASQLVRARRLGVRDCLFVVGGTREFGRLPLMASRLFIVLCCRVVVLCA
jgi:hypothetical protein